MEMGIYLLTSGLLLSILVILLAIGWQRRRLPISRAAGRHERREHPRYKTSLRVLCEGVLYEVSQKERTEQTSWIKDISRGGVRLFLNEPLKIGSSLKLEIKLPHDPKSILVTSNVVWAHKRTDDAGLHFDTVNQEDLDRIFQFINNREKLVIQDSPMRK